MESEIICIDRNGSENRFKYSIEKTTEKGNNTWFFRIQPVDIIVDEDFEFEITQIGENIGKVTQMFHHFKEEYIAKGVPEKMIEEANRILNLNIISSTNKEESKLLSTEWRTTEAEKVWIRLYAQGKAKYDPNSEIYELIGQ